MSANLNVKRLKSDFEELLSSDDLRYVLIATIDGWGTVCLGTATNNVQKLEVMSLIADLISSVSEREGISTTILLKTITSMLTIALYSRLSHVGSCLTLT